MSKSLGSLAPQGMREIISVFIFCKAVRIGSRTDRTCTRTILTAAVFTKPLSGGDFVITYRSVSTIDSHVIDL